LADTQKYNKKTKKVPSCLFLLPRSSFISNIAVSTFQIKGIHSPGTGTATPLTFHRQSSTVLRITFMSN